MSTRDQRSYDRAVLKRKMVVRRINSIHEVALRAQKEDTHIPAFMIAVHDLDGLWENFLIETEAILTHAEDISALGDSFMEQEVITRNVITAIKVIADECGKPFDKHPNTSQPDETGSGQIDEGSPSVGSVRSVIPGRSCVNENTQLVACTSRLPEIPLPTFDGQLQNWPVFRDRFTALVANRPGISDIDKFYYLIGCLDGSPTDALKGITVSSETYGLAWNTLVDRYDKPRKLATNIIDKLLSATPATQENYSALTEFLNTFDENIAILESLNIPDLGAFLLFVLASRSLPMSCRKLFESENQSEYPHVQDVIRFVKQRMHVLENASNTSLVPVNNKVNAAVGPLKPKYEQTRRPEKNRVTLTAMKPAAFKCHHCGDGHTLSSCLKFQQLSIDDRFKLITSKRLCMVCFGKDHWASKCKLSCPICSRRHHSLLHRHQDAKQSNEPAQCSLIGRHQTTTILLGTALVHIRDASGTLHVVRALIDSASQISAITSNCVTRLGLRCSKWTVPVTGLSGQRVPDIKGLVQFGVQPRGKPDPVISIKAWVMPRITGDMPTSSLSSKVRTKSAHLVLADPTFDVPSPIELLLGADVFPQVWGEQTVSLGCGFPSAFLSIFGWVLIGPVPDVESDKSQFSLISLTSSIETLLEKFWEIEEPSPVPPKFTENGRCEKLFQEEVQRDATGRFIVPLPLREDRSTDAFIGSKQIAIKRFKQLEDKLTRDPVLYEQYRTFMSEYESLGHMTVTSQPGKYIIPHHGVYKTNGEVSKLRVVFDGSARCASGVSLNECLYPGPKLQSDIVDILIGFRVHEIAFTCDICKMYRQFWVQPKYRPYQHIVWRAHQHDELKEYELNTVTYGLNCAPYLALRVLQEIATMVNNDAPEVSRTLRSHTYMDDICTGAKTIAQAKLLQTHLTQTLLQFGLELRKWSSNSPEILAAVPAECRATGSLPFNESDSVPVLGMKWIPEQDCFMYDVGSLKTATTKRGVLSLIARVFDPIGLLSPVIFYAKHLMQKIWRAQMTWDEPLPGELADNWLNFIAELPTLSSIKIPRFVGVASNSVFELCGFCDASDKGYAAVVYLRVTDPNQKIQTFLLGAKSKLAPMKAVTTPRLELCAACLLSIWLERLRKVLEEQLVLTGIFAWTDSTIVLSWLNNPQVDFKVFVSNRIYQILKRVPDCNWAHVRSENNPADCVSRGLRPSELQGHGLYWTGPDFLRHPVSNWSLNVPSFPIDQLPEIKPTALVANVGEIEVDWITRFSSYNRMLRVVTWMRRFISATRKQYVAAGVLSRSEINETLFVIARVSQRRHLAKLYQELSTKHRASSKLLNRLCPFVDEMGVIRVGGRLRNANISEDRKHPILLPKQSHLSILVARFWHIYACHAGPRLMTALIHKQFWILSVRQIVHYVRRHCTVCVRLAAENPQPIMADLPKARVQECRPFAQVGVDYAGPIMMRELNLRKSREYKVYMAVFVCLGVKAVHLELVSDLSTEAFLAAFDRFVSRRGLPSDVYSDCGTNFIGASKQLRKLINHPDNHEFLSSARACSWHFNPPSAPHFGGLWEAAVRSAKSLLTRTVGTHRLTLEEMCTVLCRVEAALNSRPLVPMSPDPHDLECLTPGHFLVGQALLTVPEYDVQLQSVNLRQRWKLLHQCFQFFWKRWSLEYLHQLQLRNRWNSNEPDVMIDQMVVIKDTGVPLQWRLGRIVELLPGKDGTIRVVRVLTKQGEIVRPVVKLVLLPTD